MPCHISAPASFLPKTFAEVVPVSGVIRTVSAKVVAFLKHHGRVEIVVVHPGTSGSSIDNSSVVGNAVGIVFVVDPNVLPGLFC